MARTDHFKKHHVDILTISRDVKKFLIAPDAIDHAVEVRRLLSQLSGKLSFHLAMEDKNLYPFMMAHPDPKIGVLSKRYSEEMGSLSRTFGEYLDRWPNPSVIVANMPVFINESRMIFNALVRRMQREDTELYPVVDQLA